MSALHQSKLEFQPFFHHLKFCHYDNNYYTTLISTHAHNYSESCLPLPEEDSDKNNNNFAMIHCSSKLGSKKMEDLEKSTYIMLITVPLKKMITTDK